MAPQPPMVARLRPHGHPSSFRAPNDVVVPVLGVPVRDQHLGLIDVALLEVEVVTAPALTDMMALADMVLSPSASRGSLAGSAF